MKSSSINTLLICDDVDDDKSSLERSFRVLPSILVYSNDPHNSLNAETRRFLDSTGARIVEDRALLPLSPCVAMILVFLQGDSDPVLQELRQQHPQAFIAVISPRIQESPFLRFRLFDLYGVNMVDRSLFSPDLRKALDQVLDQFINHSTVIPTSPSSSTSTSSSSLTPLSNSSSHPISSPSLVSYACPYCGLSPLSEDQLWTHCPLYHINVPNHASRGFPCPVCLQPQDRFQPHLRNAHGPPSRGELHSEVGHPPVHLFAFALVVCRRPSDGRFLLVQEFGAQGYWLPGGGVDGGEDLRKAAERETLEEAGVAVEIKGVLRVEFSPKGHYARLRVIYYAEPRDDSPEKTLPDYESVGAIWASPRDVLSHSFPLRGFEPLVWVKYLQNSGTIHPLSIIGSE